MLESIFTNSTSSVELTPILICSLVSIILGLLIAFTHKVTSKYNKNFLVTISILPLLVETVIIMVNGNLGTSVAILGAFSLVRFRSLPGNSKEILSVFFSMTVGLATGMGQLLFAGIITVIGCISLLLLNKVKLFDVNKYDYKLVIDKEKSLDIKVILEDSSASYEIIGNKDLKDGSVIKIVTKALDGKSKTYTITITKNDYTLYYIIAGVLLLLVVTIPVLVYFKSVKGKKKELDVNGYEKGREYEDNTASRTVIGANISSSSNVNVNNGNSVNNNSENVISDGSVGALNANNQNVNQSNDLDSFDGELQDYVPNENSNKCPSCGRELLGNPNECPYCKIRLK